MRYYLRNKTNGRLFSCMKRIKLGSLWQPTLTAMQETDKSKLGLVVEGGGVRAIYAAGVLV